MKALFRPWFVIVSILYVINRFIIARSGIPFLDHYLDDLLCVPVVLHLSARVTGWLQGEVHYRLSRWQIVGTVVYSILLFEVFLPAVSNRYTADGMDILMYVAGGFLYTIVSFSSNNKSRRIPGAF